MISETLTALSPERTIDEAKTVLHGLECNASRRRSWTRGSNYLTVAIFRSRLAISAFPDRDGRGTRVRVSTLRRNDAVGKLLTLLATGEPGTRPFRQARMTLAEPGSDSPVRLRIGKLRAVANFELVLPAGSRV